MESTAQPSGAICISPGSLSQNRFAGRVMGSIRREYIDHCVSAANFDSFSRRTVITVSVELISAISFVKRLLCKVIVQCRPVSNLIPFQRVIFLRRELVNTASAEESFLAAIAIAPPRKAYSFELRAHLGLA
jgi:hypothetical protein